MKIHEYQAKELFRNYHIPVPKGAVAKTPEDALHIAEQIGEGPYMLKAQVHAGGRGRAGGIRVVNDLNDIEKTARDMLGKKLVTHQTDGEGKPVQTLLVEESLVGTKEVYLGIVIDWQKACSFVLASAEGGMEIEKLAIENPEKVISETIDPCIGLRPFQVKRIFYALGLDGAFSREISATITNLFRLFYEKDCSLAEINPLVLTKNGQCIALDGKLNFDDNALYRHPDINDLRDIHQEDHLEVEASKYNLNYIKLDGSVGCMVNGAGLAMATMDLIKLVGAKPANFLDIGGGATKEMVKEGFRILLSDKDVTMIFINIFGGILRCDTLARGVVEAAKELVVNLPIVVRLEGTNVKEGRRILNASGLSLIIAEDLKEAAEKIKETLMRMEHKAQGMGHRGREL
jgi:succinyl-CoA synthetase beta subunit